MDEGCGEEETAEMCAVIFDVHMWGKNGEYGLVEGTWLRVKCEGGGCEDTLLKGVWHICDSCHVVQLVLLDLG